MNKQRIYQMRSADRRRESNFFNIPPNPVFTNPMRYNIKIDKPTTCELESVRDEVMNIPSGSYNEMDMLDIATETQDFISEILTPVEQFVITSFYGLNSTPELTLDEIGDELELTRGRVRQIKAKALMMMRLESDKLIDIFDF